MLGRRHGAPYRVCGYVSLRFGGTSLGKREHNNNNNKTMLYNTETANCRHRAPENVGNNKARILIPLTFRECPLSMIHNQGIVASNQAQVLILVATDIFGFCLYNQLPQFPFAQII